MGFFRIRSTYPKKKYNLQPMVGAVSIVLLLSTPFREQVPRASYFRVQDAQQSFTGANIAACGYNGLNVSSLKLSCRAPRKI